MNEFLGGSATFTSLSKRLQGLRDSKKGFRGPLDMCFQVSFRRGSRFAFTFDHPSLYGPRTYERSKVGRRCHGAICLVFGTSFLLHKDGEDLEGRLYSTGYRSSSPGICTVIRGSEHPMVIFQKGLTIAQEIHKDFKGTHNFQKTTMRPQMS